ncbi:MAG: DNA repair protein RecN [Gammaproteobacteria bacterium]|nr:DNA repair protein RecN [Gammaproteobacteria bacterium]
MLTHIHIWNFAIVDKLDIEFEPGLSVLTGETGAGKSILLDALGLALGDRADPLVIRHGAEKAEISVSFSTHDAPQAEQWLVDHQMNSAEECIIRRTISATGPSKSFINGIPSTIAQLRELGEMLVDLHGQHEHQSLLSRDIQRELLDNYAAHHTLVTQVSSAYQQWQALEREIDQLRSAGRDRDQRLDLLRHQVKELQALDVQAGEYAALEQDHKRLANANQLLHTVQQCLEALTENEQTAIEGMLAHCVSEIQSLAQLDTKLATTQELLNNALIALQEAGGELRRYADDLELDPARLTEVEQRLGDILQLARKHRVPPQELATVLPRLQTELDQLEHADFHLDSLLKQVIQAKQGYLDLAATLSQSRIKTAKQLTAKVTDSMQGLSLQGGKFSVNLETLNEEHYSLHGREQIEFLVSANPGQPLRPLSKIASGGELSRISLAIQVITAQAARIPTLIFDEVDVGIGGRVAELVGLQLRALGQHRQVVCVTHLPQVAALGHQHLQVSKHINKNTTVTKIQPLEKQQRVDEIARMLGGVQITEQTRSHAQEMIERAQV